MMRKPLLLTMLLATAPLLAHPANGDNQPEPERLVTLQLSGVTLRTALETAFDATGEPFALPANLPDAKIAYLSTKRRPLQPVVEMMYRAANQEWKGLVVTKRDGSYQIERRPLERERLELALPAVGARSDGAAGPVRLSVSVLREVAAGKIEVEIETNAPTDREIASTYHSLATFQPDGSPQAVATAFETRGVIPQFKTRSGRAIQFSDRMRRSDPSTPGRTFVTGILTVDPQDPPATLLWELYFWRS
jgi:hypothetical protein